MNGSDVLLYVNTGTEAVPVFTVVGSQRNVTFERSADEIDVSSKASDDEKILLGRKRYSVQLDSLYVPTDAAYAALDGAFENKKPIKVQRFENGVATKEAEAYITSLSEAFPDQAEATVSIGLKITSGWSEPA